MDSSILESIKSIPINSVIFVSILEDILVQSKLKFQSQSTYFLDLFCLLIDITIHMLLNCSSQEGSQLYFLTQRRLCCMYLFCNANLAYTEVLMDMIEKYMNLLTICFIILPSIIYSALK